MNFIRKIIADMDFHTIQEQWYISYPKTRARCEAIDDLYVNC